MNELIVRVDYLDKIIPFIDKQIIKVLSGIRRAGKSSLLLLLRRYLIESGVSENNIIYINKESLEWEFIAGYSELYRFVKDRIRTISGPVYLFIDEIQNISSWEKAAASILADGLADLTITGSNASLLSSDLATLLSGRFIEIPVYPLNFSDFLLFRGKNKNDINPLQEFKLFLKYGGFPGIHALELKDEYVYQYLNGIFNTLLMKDVVTRFSVRDPAQLLNISRFIFDNCGNITSAKRISDFLKSRKMSVTVDTVQKYISYLEAAFLIHRSQRFDLKGLRLLELTQKYYMGDIGLRHGLIGYKEQDISGLLENVIYLELLKRGYRVYTGKWTDREIDFIAEKDNRRIYLQVAYLISSKETADREFGALEVIKDNHPKTVLSMDTVDIPGRKGIRRQRIIDFLLESDE
ncbi:MAG: ATP-binding protein [Spirochaetia bacterium]